MAGDASLWLVVLMQVVEVPKYGRRGRPPRGVPPVERAWQVQAQLHLDSDTLEREAQRKATFLVATNILDAAAFPDLALIQTNKAQGSVEMDGTQMTRFVGRGMLISR